MNTHLRLTGRILKAAGVDISTSTQQFFTARAWCIGGEMLEINAFFGKGAMDWRLWKNKLETRYGGSCHGA